MTAHGPSRPHVVIIGGGFGGLTAARALRRTPVDVTLIDRNNHHTFQPLLYQVATATLNPSDITAPIRHVLRNQRNATVLLAEVTHVDVSARRLTFTASDHQRSIDYDYLIVASGARHSYFGHDAWEGLAPGLKTIDDALEIRRRFLVAFERAELSDDPQEQLEYMTIVVVGGGPTGVELAGLIPDVLRGIRRDFRRIDPARTRVVLIEGGPRSARCISRGDFGTRVCRPPRAWSRDPAQLDRVEGRAQQGVRRRRLHRDPQHLLGSRERRVTARPLTRRAARSRWPRPGEPRPIGSRAS